MKSGGRPIGSDRRSQQCMGIAEYGQSGLRPNDKRFMFAFRNDGGIPPYGLSLLSCLHRCHTNLYTNLNILLDFAMAAVSIRLPEKLLKEADQRARELHMSRAEYIRLAIESENTETADRLRRERMMAASRRVREESMRVNAEFDAIEDAPDAQG